MSTEGDFSQSSVVIVGLGLMGGSLAFALKGKCKRLLAIDRDRNTLALALEQNAVDAADTDPSKILPQADKIILALPVRSIMEFIPLIPEVHHGPAIVMDIGSTKVEILGKMAELPLSFDPIGGHPMCGKELAGFENADPGIYHGAPFVLTPLERTSERAKNFALDLVRAVGAESVWLDPETHDSWVATTSHLPYLLSVGLVASAPPEVASVVGPGFRDVSRLAGSDRQMMLDILSTNKEKVLKAIRRFRENLKELEETMMEGDYSKLADLLERTSQQRDGFIEDQVIDETRD